jgi:integrase/recombinase XerD
MPLKVSAPQCGVSKRDPERGLQARPALIRKLPLPVVRVSSGGIVLGPGAHIYSVGNGRKERGKPITEVARRALQASMKEPWPIGSAFLSPSISGRRLSADAVQDLVNKHVAAARMKCPSLVRKRVTPHVLRHTAAVELLQAGVDRSMIALWLGMNR